MVEMSKDLRHGVLHGDYSVLEHSVDPWVCVVSTVEFRPPPMVSVGTVSYPS